MTHSAHDSAEKPPQWPPRPRKRQRSTSERTSPNSRRSPNGTAALAQARPQAQDVSRFKSAGHFASYNATAPIEASSGEHRRHRLNPRGNRQLNYAIHIAAITQLRYPCAGREYHDRRCAEGKNSKEAIRALKRHISNTIYRALVADARRIHG